MCLTSEATPYLWGAYRAPALPPPTEILSVNGASIVRRYLVRSSRPPPTKFFHKYATALRDVKGYGDLLKADQVNAKGGTIWRDCNPVRWWARQECLPLRTQEWNVTGVGRRWGIRGGMEEGGYHWGNKTIKGSYWSEQRVRSVTEWTVRGTSLGWLVRRECHCGDNRNERMRPVREDSLSDHWVISEKCHCSDQWDGSATGMTCEKEGPSQLAAEPRWSIKLHHHTQRPDG